LIHTLNHTAGDVLGLLPQGDRRMSNEDFEQIMNLVLDLRNQLRKEKQFNLTDKIRDRLNELGIAIKDGPEGSSWEKR